MIKLNPIIVTDATRIRHLREALLHISSSSAQFARQYAIDALNDDEIAAEIQDEDADPCHGPEDTWCPSCGLGGDRETGRPK